MERQTPYAAATQAFLPKVEITAFVEDARAEEVIRKMVETARTGRMGDGKIFVLSAQPYEAVLGGAAKPLPS